MSPNPVSSSIVQEVSPAQSASLSAAAGFLLGRIDFERTPPAGNATSTFRLARMEDLLRRLDNPQLKLPCIHIAGSKGKGSTAAMTAAILAAAGHRTGLFTSPHIDRFEERIQIDGDAIPSDRFAELVDRLRPVAETMDALPLGGPTFFELTTALAWLYFAERQVDLVVLEVGLGGRLDATNLCRPLVTIITSISRDHTRILGDELEQIAREKAGIIKSNVPVLTAVRETAPLRVIRDRAAEQACACDALGETIRIDGLVSTASTIDGLPQLTVNITTPFRKHTALMIPLPGHHQCGNTALAVAAVDLLDSTGAFTVPGTAIESGLRNVRWPLRIEVLARHPLLIADAAHNEASLAALIETIRDVPAQRRVAVVAISRDKDAAAMLRLLTSAFDDLILTRFLGNPRAIDQDELRRLCGSPPECRVHSASTPQDSLALAKSLATADDLICATGSIFLAAEVRRLVQPPASDR